MGMPTKRRAREAVPATISTLNTIVSERLADLLARDPEFRDSALEMGIIDPKWLDDPTKEPISRVPPLEVARRFLERSVERRPSMLNKFGLNALQVLSASAGGVRAGSAQSVVTVVFTDLEGFTRYTSANGDDAALELLAEHHRIVGPIVRKWGGRVVKRLGDGLMLAFQDPAYGVRAAVEMVAAQSDGLRLRAGVHTGVAAAVDDDLVGHVVNVAARITDVAKGGQVLVSQETLDAAGELPEFAFSRIARKRVKGVSDPVPVRQVRPRRTRD